MATKTTAFTGPVVVGLNDKKGEIRLTDGKNVNEAKYLSIAAPDTITSDTTLTFPNGAGTAGQILSTDGNGTLSWVNDSAGNPAGTNGQVQTNDGGTFGAISEGSSGQVLTSNGAGVAPTFQTSTSGIAAVVDDTTPELGGDLASNGHDIDFADGDKAKFGDSGDLEIFHDGTNSLIKDVGTGQLKISGFDAVKITNGDDTIPSAQFISSGEAQLYYAGSQKLAANTDGIAVTGKIGINDTTPSRALTIGGGSDAKIQFKEGGTQSLYFGDSGSDFAGFINYNHSDNRMKISASDIVELQSSAADITLTNKVRIQNSYDLPNSDGTAGQVMTTDGAGNVTFQTPSGSAPDPVTSSLDVGPTKTIKLDAVYPNGTRNVFMGENAGAGVTTADGNVGIGFDALLTGNGNGNVAIGRAALDSATGSDNIGIGVTAASNTSGSNNICIGSGAAANMTALSSENVIIGRAAGNGSVSGAKNAVIIGDVACLSNVPSNSVAIGASAMGSTSGADNTAVGQGAGTGIGTGTNNTCLGHNADPSTSGVSNEITLGDSSIATLRCNQTSISALSDARDKKDVEDVNVGLDFINDLRPVKFVWDTRDGAKKDIKEVGFIAQELDEVQQKHGIEDSLQLVLKNNPDKLEAAPGKLIPILVQAIKDLKKEIDELKKA